MRVEGITSLPAESGERKARKSPDGPVDISDRRGFLEEEKRNRQVRNSRLWRDFGLR
jgi:hypothetical protein